MGTDRKEPTLEFQAFKRRLRELCGFDLDSYKGPQMERRTRQWMERRGIPSMGALIRRLEADKKARSDFLDYLTINTSQFFRDPGTWEALRVRVLPGLLASFGHLRIWSAACSIGAEPYTLAIILDEMGQGGRHYLLATDIDEDALARAKVAEYHDLHLPSLPASSRQRYFTRTPGGMWRLDAALAATVRFRRHDLLREPYPLGFHLILCRHVMIYLTQEAQSFLLTHLAQALVAGGYLVVGGPEQIARPDEFGLERIEHSIYRRPPAGPSVSQAGAATASTRAAWPGRATGSL
ncbi:MAG: protein-glutamate O-methyltransferase CheR [Bacillota bacterium]